MLALSVWYIYIFSLSLFDTYAQAYKTKIVAPFIKKLKDVVRSLIAQCLQLMETVKNLKAKLSDAHDDIDKLTEGIQATQAHNSELKEYVKDYIYVRKALGNERTNKMIHLGKAKEQYLKQQSVERAQKGQNNRL